MVESRALLKLRAPKGHRGFESLPHRHCSTFTESMTLAKIVRVHVTKIRTLFDRWGALRAWVKSEALRLEPKRSFG